MYTYQTPFDIFIVALMSQFICLIYSNNAYSNILTISQKHWNIEVELWKPEDSGQNGRTLQFPFYNFFLVSKDKTLSHQ